MHYKLWDTRIAFQKAANAETSIIRPFTATSKMRIGATSDLESAYERLSRKLMMELMKRELPYILNGIIAGTSQPLRAVTKAVDIDSMGKIARKATHGSPFIPPFFNKYMG